MVDVHLSIGFAPSDDGTALLTEDKMFVRIVFGEEANLESLLFPHYLILNFWSSNNFLLPLGKPSI